MRFEREELLTCVKDFEQYVLTLDARLREGKGEVDDMLTRYNADADLFCYVAMMRFFAQRCTAEEDV